MDNNEILLKTLQKENDLIIENTNKLKNKCNDLQNELNKVKAENDYQKLVNSNLKEERDRLQQQLDSILYSRSYKIIQKIKKIVGR